MQNVSHFVLLRSKINMSTTRLTKRGQSRDYHHAWATFGEAETQS